MTDARRHVATSSGITLVCHNCRGPVPATIKRVALTVKNQLVIYWRCGECGRKLYTFKSFDECLGGCLSAQEEPATVAQPKEMIAELDAQFLRTLGVRPFDD
jgi:hypothetical protein